MECKYAYAKNSNQVYTNILIQPYWNVNDATDDALEFYVDVLIRP